MEWTSKLQNNFNDITSRQLIGKKLKKMYEISIQLIRKYVHKPKKNSISSF